MTASPQPQASLYETTIEDEALERALEDREQLKAKKTTATKAFKDADDQAKALIKALDLGDGAPVRVGRFVLSEREIAGKTVQFETGPTSRITIKPLDDLGD